MKVLAVALLCLFAAVQGRSTGAEVSTAAAPGENPWLVHLRVAVSTSGLLNSCLGSLISETFVVTTASCVSNARFVWIRYGVVDVIRPELVTETSSVRLHPEYNAETGENNVALISINRVVQFTDNIKPLILPPFDFETPATGKVCGFGANEAGGPGESLSCYNVDIVEDGDDLIVTSDEGQATQYDIGSPLVLDGTAYGVLVGAPSDDSKFGAFVNDVELLKWVVEQAGLQPGGVEPESY